MNFKFKNKYLKKKKNIKNLKKQLNNSLEQ